MILDSLSGKISSQEKSLPVLSLCFSPHRRAKQSPLPFTLFYLIVAGSSLFILTSFWCWNLPFSSVYNVSTEIPFSFKTTNAWFCKVRSHLKTQRHTMFLTDLQLLAFYFLNENLTHSSFLFYETPIELELPIVVLLQHPLIE